MKFEHKFVEAIPPTLDPQVIYVSIRYRTAKHLCPCGCGHEVVTPIRPNKWAIKYDGVSVSLHPSVGNWSLECKSHYWIHNSQILWSDMWSQEQIEIGRAEQRLDDAEYFRTVSSPDLPAEKQNKSQGVNSLVNKIKQWLRFVISRQI